MVPMPEAPPWISTVCPARRPAVITRFDQTVQAASGRPAALQQVDAGGNRQHLDGRHRDPLRVAAAGQQRAHLVADLPPDDPRPEPADHPGALHAQDRRGTRRYRVVAGRLQQVRPVHGGGCDLYQDLARAGHGIGNLPPAQCRRRTFALDGDCPHEPESNGGPTVTAHRAARNDSLGRPGPVVGFDRDGQATTVTPPDRSLAEYWPVFGLRLATPRLTLIAPAGRRPGGDAGRHPGRHPRRWRDAVRDAVDRCATRRVDPEHAALLLGDPGSVHAGIWSVPFIVRRARRAGRPAGTRRHGTSPSPERCEPGPGWAPHIQGDGIGTEMRSAVVQFAFDHLKADRADSGAFTDNAPRCGCRRNWATGLTAPRSCSGGRGSGRSSNDSLSAPALHPSGLGCAGPGTCPPAWRSSASDVGALGVASGCPGSPRAVNSAGDCHDSGACAPNRVATLRVGRPRVRGVAGRMPAPALFLASGFTQYAGAALAVGLFAVIPAASVAWWRLRCRPWSCWRGGARGGSGGPGGNWAPRRCSASCWRR